jgi:energy-coupling factor transporter ATP-binding protein EcfA2
MSEITIYKNIWSKEPHFITIAKALERIKNGTSKEKVNDVRNAIDKDRANELKKHLPSVCFSGTFEKERENDKLKKHSGYLVLDFDGIENPKEYRDSLKKYDYIFSAWISPGGNGVKALVKIAEPKKHIEHFQSLQDVFNIDKSGVNVARVCYESFDPEIWTNENAAPFTKLKKQEKVIERVRKENNIEIFNNIFKWLSNKGSSFVSGERNIFIFKLAGACCRFGIDEDDCFNLCNMSFLSNDNSFTNSEAQQTIKSAYKQNKNTFGSASFENEVLVDRITKSEVDIKHEDFYNLEVRPKDVVYGEDVKQEALNIYLNGYEGAKSTYIPEIDRYFKFKKGEITLLTGFGNYGKSTFLKYLLFIQALKDGEKIAIFTPEENPASEFYHDLVEMYFGTACTPDNENRPTIQDYESIYDFVSRHFFFVYPTTVEPTPEYVMERFLELIIKEKISFCVIDPFNQLTNDYKGAGGNVAKYLELMLSKFSRFAQQNNIYSITVAHPKASNKTDDKGNYECPDVFDIADGAMWNNKMDNIIIYHLPERQSNPDSTHCQLHSKKIRRRKIVGVLGTLDFEYSPRIRRYFINGRDYMNEIVFGKKEKPALKENNDFLTEAKPIITNNTYPF